MDDLVKKPKVSRRGTRPPVPVAAGDGARAAAPVAGVQGSDVAATLAKVAPNGAVQENPAAVAGAAAAGQPEAKAKSGSDAGTRKPKLVRGSFTVPKDEYARLADLKKTCRQDGLRVKKSQLLRVAITLLRDLDSARLAQMVAGLPATKRRRAKRGK
jgi:hypothetical protein